MSRSNPFKRSKRRPKHTILCVGEGATEKAFLNHLKQTYLNRYGGKSVTNRSGNGGSPDLLLKSAIRWKEVDAFDELVCFIDSDIPITRSGKELIKKYDVKVLNSNPCIEGLFLKILDHPSFIPERYPCYRSKKIFHQHYISEYDKLFPSSYNKVFPKTLLDKKLNTISILRGLVQVFA